jgi:asparagine synthase (glutamine-hydrolysing)
MCGIAGILADRVDEQLVDLLVQPLTHRGPDDRGTWVDRDAGVGLGHRRLSIIDLSVHGHQPMQSADGRLLITYNGEIYNHREIRTELDRAGKAPAGGWRGQSDTETLLQAISVWGLRSALGKCDGMFAFALWDRQSRELFLARDRFGEKPLYYGWAARSFLFASELKAFTAHPDFDNVISGSAVRAFASRGYVPAPLSIYERIFKLEPGCILTVPAAAFRTPRDAPVGEGESGNGISLERYWRYADVVRQGLDEPIEDEGEAIRLLEQALAHAIGLQRQADVPVGAFLSGGIDSSTVVALYQKYSPVPVRSFTIGFDDPALDEAGHARSVAQALGTVHHDHYVSAAEARDVIPRLPAIYDEPFADSSQIPTFLVSQFARSEVKVALTGDGGDELFGGYRRHFLGNHIWRNLERLPAAVRKPLARALAQLPAGLWTRSARALGKKGDHWGGAVHDLLRSAQADDFDEFFLSFVDLWAFEPSPVRADPPRLASTSLADLGAGAPNVVRGMYCDAMTYLPDDILCKVDRASMALSLETRLPFLDRGVAEIAARIPTRMKIRGRSGKLVLRNLLARELPRSLFERPKAGFAAPVGAWLRGPLRDWAEALFDPRKLTANGWFDPAPVRARWHQHLTGARDYAPSLWAILMFQAWLDENVADRSASVASAPARRLHR